MKHLLFFLFLVFLLMLSGCSAPGISRNTASNPVNMKRPAVAPGDRLGKPKAVKSGTQMEKSH